MDNEALPRFAGDQRRQNEHRRSPLRLARQEKVTFQGDLLPAAVYTALCLEI
jgi:hypothetical protein